MGDAGGGVFFSLFTLLCRCRLFVDIKGVGLWVLPPPALLAGRAQACTKAVGGVRVKTPLRAVLR